MKIIALLLAMAGIILGFFLCVDYVNGTIKECTPKEDGEFIMSARGSRIVEIEGCEYIVTRCDRSRSICHKGNCKNPIHIYNVNQGENKE